MKCVLVHKIPSSSMVAIPGWKMIQGVMYHFLVHRETFPSMADRA
jgi:hypothetical protein